MAASEQKKKYSDWKYEEWNEHQDFTIAVYHNDHMNGYIVGHKPFNFFKVVCKFLQIPNRTVFCHVNGVVGHRVEISVI